MKIVHLLWSLDIGGVENMLVDIINEQIKTDQVCLMIINDLVNEEIANTIDNRVNVIRIGRSPGSKNPWPIFKLNFLLAKFSPDILHCHLDDQSKLIWQNWKMVRTIHNTHSSSKGLQRYKKIFCISNAVKNYAASLGYPDGIVIFNGIHAERIKSSPRSSKGKDLKFVCVGRLHTDKGQQLIIDAADELVNKMGRDGFVIDLIGDGPQREDLESKILGKGLNQHIRLLGMKSRDWLYSQLCEYDLLILPSLSEGFGLTLAEAVMAKVPVITSDLPGPMEIINNGKFGTSFQAGDAHALARKMNQFVEMGRDEQQIEKAYQFVKNNFDIRVTARRYLEEYQKLLGDS